MSPEDATEKVEKILETNVVSANDISSNQKLTFEVNLKDKSIIYQCCEKEQFSENFRCELKLIHRLKDRSLPVPDSIWSELSYPPEAVFKPAGGE